MTSSLFRDRSAFAPASAYRLLPCRFLRLDAERYVLTSDVGEYVVLSRRELEAFVKHELDPASDPYRTLKSKHFLFDDNSRCALDLAALKLRTRAERLAEFTALHLFVVTLRCDLSCHYCQVSRQTEDRVSFDMSLAHAMKALELVFKSPSPQLKIEFQGGEPLLAFDTVRAIVVAAEQMNLVHKRDLEFVVATNLNLLTDEILEFCSAHKVALSTSLDGPADLHDKHRVRRGEGSHAATVAGIRRAQEALGAGRVQALMTTTEASLGRATDIIDEYVRLGLSSVFLRSLSPYGFAVRSRLTRRYDASAWLAFYKQGVAHALNLAKQGVDIREEFATLLLSNVLKPRGSGFVDLQSPAGIGIGAVVYNYDGAVYASDEGRMLAEMGNQSFRLGHVDEQGYEDLFLNDALVTLLDESVGESSPMCSDCAFVPFCGTDPVFHVATMGEPVGHKALSGFCHKQMGVLRYLICLLEDDPGARVILEQWVWS